MKRLEVREQEICNFNSIMKGLPFLVLLLFLYTNFSPKPVLFFSLFHIAEYKNINDSFQTADNYARNVCLRVRMATSISL